MVLPKVWYQKTLSSTSSLVRDYQRKMTEFRNNNKRHYDITTKHIKQISLSSVWVKFIQKTRKLLLLQTNFWHTMISLIYENYGCILETSIVCRYYRVTHITSSFSARYAERHWITNGSHDTLWAYYMMFTLRSSINAVYLPQRFIDASVNSLSDDFIMCNDYLYN